VVCSHGAASLPQNCFKPSGRHGSHMTNYTSHQKCWANQDVGVTNLASDRDGIPNYFTSGSWQKVGVIMTWEMWWIHPPPPPPPPKTCRVVHTVQLRSPATDFNRRGGKTATRPTVHHIKNAEQTKMLVWLT
jgi:hypothetical protein